MLAPDSEFQKWDFYCTDIWTKNYLFFLLFAFFISLSRLVPLHRLAQIEIPSHERSHHFETESAAGADFVSTCV